MIFFGAFIIILCVAVFIVSGGYPVEPLSAGGGAAVYPRMVAIALCLLMIYYLAHNRGRTEGTGRMKAKLRDIISINRYWLAFTGSMLLVPVLLKYFGFRPTAVVGIILTGSIMSRKSGAFSKATVAVIVLVAVGVSLGVAFLFEGYLKFPLPRGLLFS